MPSEPPPGFANFDQWLSGTQLERELKLQEYSVSNRGLRPNFVGTTEQVRERIEEHEAVGLDLLRIREANLRAQTGVAPAEIARWLAGRIGG